MEWYYHLLKPGEHYLPLLVDFSDLGEKVRWAREHDAEAQAVAAGAARLVEKRVTPRSMHCYMLHVLWLLAEAQQSPQPQLVGSSSSSLPSSVDPGGGGAAAGATTATAAPVPSPLMSAEAMREYGFQPVEDVLRVAVGKRGGVTTLKVSSATTYPQVRWCVARGAGLPCH